jgi:MerR family transcriptional regulator, copper efflux regulator
MLIHQLVQRTGLPRDTIRFYEKQGLLDATHVQRQANTYRTYTEQAVQRLQLIRQAQTAGFTLREIKELIHAWENNAMTIDAKIVLFEHKIEQLTEQIRTLEHVRAYLGNKLRRVKATASVVEEWSDMQVESKE